MDGASDMDGETAEVSSPSATDTEGATCASSFFFTGKSSGNLAFMTPKSSMLSG